MSKGESVSSRGLNSGGSSGSSYKGFAANVASGLKTNQALAAGGSGGSGIAARGSGSGAGIGAGGGAGALNSARSAGSAAAGSGGSMVKGTVDYNNDFFWAKGLNKETKGKIQAMYNNGMDSIAIKRKLGW